MLGANIRKYRKLKGYSQAFVAQHLHVTPQTISKWETNKSMPDVGSLYQLALFLDVSFEQLLGPLNESEPALPVPTGWLWCNPVVSSCLIMTLNLLQQQLPLVLLLLLFLIGSYVMVRPWLKPMYIRHYTILFAGLNFSLLLYLCSLVLFNK
ncbi:helix-turn-helix domain-containing protein [Brochothrix campestris]|uniref:HTH cro/C1-type domain-containing protein n=1 Tax=Brochothrix campestris FSL F6-1037 TaxID=1265861 RepID=W7CPP8_9LIST|nr:helix-turn-helix transcriptional regulator [Brochothrix campestris]EUJ41629.1 hypothetical protein BCAMP_03085 [Brochothrix campestris FSL F6-1037]